MTGMGFGYYSRHTQVIPGGSKSAIQARQAYINNIYRIVRCPNLTHESLDENIRREIETVRTRRIILGELEKGPRTGNDLRKSIQEDMVAEAKENTRRKTIDPDDYPVTDPKLYFNTKHLEDLGIVTSRKESHERIYSLHPKAVHAVRRVLGVTRPTTVVTSMTRPDDIRPLIHWFTGEAEAHFRNLRLVVEKERFSKGVTKDLERFVAEGSTKRWSSRWDELPEHIVGYYDGGKQGDLMATYAHIEKILLEEIPEHSVVLDLSTAPPIIAVAFCLLSNDYSIPAIHIKRHTGAKTAITHYIPGAGLI
jgi:DNA-binding PadR family transcriptional regulator